MVIETARRRLRDRRARRLLDRARSKSPPNLEGAVPSLQSIVEADEGDARFVAVQGLSAIARSEQSHPVRERAVDALLDLLAEGTDPVRQAVSPELRYVALERPDVVARLDEPYAGVIESESGPARRQVATDAGVLLAERDADPPMPATLAALRRLLLGGAPSGRRAAARAYVLLAGTPSAVDEAGTVAEHLAILRGELEEPLFAPDSHLAQVADGRTLDDAVSAYSAVDG